MQLPDEDKRKDRRSIAPSLSGIDFSVILVRIVAVGAILLAAVPVLAAKPKPLAAQPFPDAQEYADASLQLSRGNGYATYVHGGDRQPPRYPPGFSALLAPFARWGGDYPQSVQRGAKVFALATLVAVCLGAWALGGPAAAGVAALIAGTSPFYSTMATLVMSDAVGMLFAVVPLILLTRRGIGAAAAAGAIAGAGVLVRLASIVTLPALAVAFGRSRLAIAAVVGAVPLIAVLLASQWATFGHPLKTGYDHYFPTLQEFDLGYSRDVDLVQKEGPFIIEDRLDGRLMDWVCPCVAGGPMRDMSNVTFYAAVALGLFWVFTPPLVTFFAIWELIRRRRSPVAKYASLAIAANVLLFVPYFHQGARFLAPTGGLLTIFAAAGLVSLTSQALRWMLDARGAPP
jgi:4-amino-4-deoxy-L-arabinose transferase-like glycosyltransferase